MVYGQSVGRHQQWRGVTRVEGAAARVLHILLPLRICAPHLAAQLLSLFTGPSSLSCELRHAARSSPADGHDAILGLPKPTDTMDPLTHTTGKPAAALNGLVGGGGHCE